MTAFNPWILILDFGSQYTQLIARRVRELGVHCEIKPYDIDSEVLSVLKPAGIILSGGPETVTSAQSPRAPDQVFQLGCPVLGICYGLQTMAQQLGGQVSTGSTREGGYARARVEQSIAWLDGISDAIDSDGHAILDVWMSHGDYVEQLPPGFKRILSTATTPIAGMADEHKHFYGVQFHPEVTHTPKGKQLLERFVTNICHCVSHRTAADILAQSQAEIHQTLGKEAIVVLGLSGGVDSTVLAALLHRTIGERLRPVFVDTGLIWESHRNAILTLSKELNLPILTINAKSHFLNALKGITDPEKKRKCIGRVFIEIFEKEATNKPKAQFLAQGTILSDVIESASSESKGHAIKSHHNVGGLPEAMALQLLEPLRNLFKDEVHQLGVTLGLKKEFLHQHPFPGPGLAIRIIGEVTEERLTILSQADKIFQEVLQKFGMYQKISQAFCVLLPINTVGVIGDARHYGPVIAIRAVNTTDFMTAHWTHLSYDCLETVSNRIINEIPTVSRVVYDISSKPPATIEWE